MIVDTSALAGSWPFRAIPYGEAKDLRAVLSSAGVGHAIVGSLGAALYRNPQDGNEELYRQLADHRDFFTPAVTLDPSYAAWEKDLAQGIAEGSVVVRTYPQYQGWGLNSPAGNELARACIEAELPLLITTEIEDSRQRHWMDSPRDWIGGDLRALVEANPQLIAIVSNAKAPLIREIALGLPQSLRDRVFYDTSGVWGPIFDDLKVCCDQIGHSQFLFGTHSALKAPEAALARVKLTEMDEDEKNAILENNIRTLVPRLT